MAFTHRFEMTLWAPVLAFSLGGCDGSDALVVFCSFVAGMLGSFLVFQILGARAKRTDAGNGPARYVDSDDTVISADRSRNQARSPSQLARVASAHGGVTEVFMTQCPQHPQTTATWTCRFCKRDQCEACRNYADELVVCPRRACREVAMRQAAAAKPQARGRR